jgi:hypothetical protein
MHSHLVYLLPTAQQLLITFSKEKAQFMRDLNAFMTSQQNGAERQRHEHLRKSSEGWQGS